MSKIRRLLILLASLLDELIAIAVIIWVLPALGIRLPVQTLIVIIALLAVYAVISARFVMRAVARTPVAGFTDMTGSRGAAVSDLCPEGCVRLHGEIWQAVAEGRNIRCGEKVIVVSQNGLKLRVKTDQP